MLSNKSPADQLAQDVANFKNYTPHSEHGDDGYYKDPNHHLSHIEEMRALELDPDHFYKV